MSSATNVRARTTPEYARLVLLAAILAGCRADSLTTPAESTGTGAGTACADQPGCRTSDATPVDPVVFASVADARERLIPMLDDAGVRGTLTTTLQSLEQTLHDNRSADARVRLAEVYVQLDRLRVVVAGSDPVDLPDVAAIRLALVPVANALGVRAL